MSVREGIWDDTIKIAKIGKWRHTVIFTAEGNRESVITFCNNCADAFTIDGHCASCGMAMPRENLLEDGLVMERGTDNA